MKKRKNQALGFTILEMMIAVAIAGVMAAVAVPNLTAFVKNNCMTTSANNLITSLQIAKSEAVKGRTTITVNPSKNSGDADYATNEWGEGWTVSNATETIRVTEQTCGIGSITIDGDDTSVSYDSSGFTNTTSTFTICDDRTGETGRVVSLNTLGRPATTNATCP